MTRSECAQMGGAAILSKFGREYYADLGRLGAAAPVLRERLREGFAPCATARDIAASYGFRHREIVSGQRTPELVACRVEIAVLMRRRGLTYEEIGRRLRCHRTTASYMLNIWQQVTGEVV